MIRICVVPVFEREFSIRIRVLFVESSNITYEEEVSHDPDFESGAISTLRFPLIARFHWIVPTCSSLCHNRVLILE